MFAKFSAFIKNPRKDANESTCWNPFVSPGSHWKKWELYNSSTHCWRYPFYSLSWTAIFQSMEAVETCTYSLSFLRIPKVSLCRYHPVWEQQLQLLLICFSSPAHNAASFPTAFFAWKEILLFYSISMNNEDSVPMTHFLRSGPSLLPCIKSPLASSSQPCSLCLFLCHSPWWYTGTNQATKPHPTFARLCYIYPTHVHSAESTGLWFPVHPKAASQWLAGLQGKSQSRYAGLIH